MGDPNNIKVELAILFVCTILVLVGYSLLFVWELNQARELL